MTDHGCNDPAVRRKHGYWNCGISVFPCQDGSTLVQNPPVSYRSDRSLTFSSTALTSNSSPLKWNVIILCHLGDTLLVALLLFMSMGWDCLWTAATNKPIVHPPPHDTRVWNPSGMIMAGKNLTTRRKPCLSATLSATNPTWTDPGTNLVLRCERPATNRLSQGFPNCDRRTTISMPLKCSVGHGLGKKQLNSKKCKIFLH
jgi:hypothetical protein